MKLFSTPPVLSGKKNKKRKKAFEGAAQGVKARRPPV